LKLGLAHQSMEPFQPIQAGMKNEIGYRRTIYVCTSTARPNLCTFSEILYKNDFFSNIVWKVGKINWSLSLLRQE